MNNSIDRASTSATDKPRFSGEWVRLGELISRAKVERCGDRSFPVYSMTMHNGIVAQAGRFKKSVASNDKSFYKVVKKNQLVVGFPIDEGVIYVQNYDKPGIMSPAYNIWDFDCNKISPAYLELALHSPQSMAYYADKMRGTTARRRSITAGELKSLPIMLPSIDRQCEVVEVMNNIKEQISAARQVAAELDVLVKSRFNEMFGDPVYGKRWPSVTLAELCTKLGSGATPLGGKSAYKTEGVPFVRSMNVRNGRFEWKDLAYIDDDQALKLKSVTLEKGDVLLNITGASVARSCLLPDELAGGRVNQHVSIVRINQDKMLPIVLNAVLISDSYQSFLLSGSKTAGSTREALTKGDLEKMTAPLPPVDLQRQFAAFVRKVDKLRFMLLGTLRLYIAAVHFVAQQKVAMAGLF